MYRLGANGQSLPVNQPKVAVNNGKQDGALNSGHTTSGVNYEPSRLEPRPAEEKARYSELPVSGTTKQAKITREHNFKKA
ncbi:catalase, partial [Pseudomonas syringae group genomosp. 7]|uniref:catalase n=1 Tax=Pseudomonas syringae group genomosp. 7 TaxID=251699 RepID=UPI0037701139